MGIGYVCASTILSAVMSVGIKWLSETYPAVELSFFRSVFGFIPVMLLAFSFLAPLFMTVLSVPMLGEAVGMHPHAVVSIEPGQALGWPR